MKDSKLQVKILGHINKIKIVRDESLYQSEIKSLASIFEDNKDDIFINIKYLLENDCPPQVFRDIRQIVSDETIRDILRFYYEVLEGKEERKKIIEQIKNEIKNYKDKLSLIGVTTSFEERQNWENIISKLEDELNDLTEEAKELTFDNLISVFQTTKGLKYGEEIFIVYYTLFQFSQNINATKDIALLSKLRESTINRKFEPLYKEHLIAIEKLELIADDIFQSENAKNIQDKVSFLNIARLKLDDLENYINENIKVSTPFLDVVRLWHSVIDSAMDEQIGKAVVDISLATESIFYNPKVITLAFHLQNTGLGPAKNVTITLDNTSDYQVISKKTQNIFVLPSGSGKVDVEYRITPFNEEKLDILGKATYQDLKGDIHTISIGERVRFKKPKQLEFEEIVSPYIVGPPLKDERTFFGREDIFKFISENISRSSSDKSTDHVIVLHGERRIGKTSVLYQIKRRFRNNYIPVLIDMQAMSNRDSAGFFYGIAKEIRLELEKVEIKEGIPKLTISDFKEYPFIVFTDFLDDVSKHIGNKKLLMMFDEFEGLETNVRQGKMSIDIFANLRNLVQHRNELSFIFCGTHKLEDMEKDYWSVFFNIALPKEIDVLTETEALQLITEPVGNRVQYDPFAVKKIIVASGCQPFFIQMICHNLISHLNREKRNYIGLDNVEIVINQCIKKDYRHFLDFLWEQVADKIEERIILGIIASALEQPEEDLSYTSILNRTIIETRKPSIKIKIEESDISRILDELTYRKVLMKISDKANGDFRYKFKADIIRKWIKENKPLKYILRNA